MTEYLQKSANNPFFQFNKWFRDYFPINFSGDKFSVIHYSEKCKTKTETVVENEDGATKSGLARSIKRHWKKVKRLSTKEDSEDSSKDSSSPAVPQPSKKRFSLELLEAGEKFILTCESEWALTDVCSKFQILDDFSYHYYLLLAVPGRRWHPLPAPVLVLAPSTSSRPRLAPSHPLFTHPGRNLRRAPGKLWPERVPHKPEHLHLLHPHTLHIIFNHFQPGLTWHTLQNVNTNSMLRTLMNCLNAFFTWHSLIHMPESAISVAV